jgi:hypothetical protein
MLGRWRPRHTDVPLSALSPFWASASGLQLRSRAVRGLRSQLAVREAGRAAPPLLRHPAGQRQAAEPVGQWGRRQLSPHHPWQLAAVADCYLPVPPLLCRAAGEGCPSQLWNIRLQPSLRRHGRSTSHTGQIAAAPNASPLCQQRTRSVVTWQMALCARNRPGRGYPTWTKKRALAADTCDRQTKSRTGRRCRLTASPILFGQGYGCFPASWR